MARKKSRSERPSGLRKKRNQASRQANKARRKKKDKGGKTEE